MIPQQHQQRGSRSQCKYPVIAVTVSAVALLTIFPGSVRAADNSISLDSSSRIQQTVTFYQQHFALFNERYRLPPISTDARILIHAINPDLDVSSISASGFGPLTALNFHTPDYSFSDLLKQNIGQKITLQRRDGDGSNRDRREGTLIAVQNDGVLMSQNRRLELIRFDGPWRILLDAPKQLDTDTYLSLSTQGKGAQKTGSLSYLADGLSWSPSYDLRLDEQHDQLDLTARAILVNNSRGMLNNSQIRLLAGEVNRGRIVSQLKQQKVMTVSARAMSAAAPTETASAGYHLYTLPMPLTLAPGESTQVPFLTRNNIAFTSTYTLSQTVNGYSEPESRTRHPQQQISFRLPGTGTNGTPLPAGTAHVYTETDGQPLYIGGQSLNATAASETVKLDVGEAFDITVKQHQTNIERNNDQTDVAYRIEFSNAETQPRTITYSVAFRQPWEITDSSEPGQKAHNTQIWQITVPAGQTRTLDYRVRLTMPSSSVR